MDTECTLPRTMPNMMRRHQDMRIRSNWGRSQRAISDHGMELNSQVIQNSLFRITTIKK